jgi:hypothetical protein
MKTSIHFLFTFIFTICFCGNIYSDDYAEYALEVREAVWAWDKPEFKNYAVPDEYKKESAVILAHHEDIKALSKNKLRFSMSLFFNLNRELYYTSIDRQMVKINDKVALEKYSEISYKEEAQVWGVVRSNKFNTVVGVRIIKPDGSIRDVNVDDEAVAVTEGKKDKEAYHKLAIPGLQVGDVIDYFFCHRMELETQNVGIQYFTFYDEYPILSYSVHCEISRKLTVEYAVLNGAPDLVQSTNEDKDIVLDVVQENIPKIETSHRWTSPLRDLPIIRMNILNNASKTIGKLQTARKEGVYKSGDNLQQDHIIDDAINFLNAILRTPYLTWGSFSDVKKVIKNYQKKYPDTTPEELADFIYDAVHFYTWNNHYIRPVEIYLIYTYFLSIYKIPFERVLAPNKYGARLNDILTKDDLTYCAKINDRRYGFYPNILFQTPDRMHPGCEGEDAWIYTAIVKEKNKMKGKTVTEHNVKLPQTQAEDNKNLSRINVTFSPDEPSILLIDRKEEYSGHLKYDMHALLGSYEAWDAAMRKRLLLEKSREEEMRANRNDRKYVDEMLSAFEKRRDSQKDSVKVEIHRFHDLDPREVSAFELPALGITPDEPKLKYSITYSLEGLVKKAGKNLVLDAGKLIGLQWAPDAGDRARTLNAYIPSARMYAWEIDVQISGNYKLQGLEKLNISLANEYASFRASATLDGQVLKIRAEKAYLRSFVPVSSWNQLLEVMDKANDFYVQSLVFSPI